MKKLIVLATLLCVAATGGIRTVHAATEEDPSPRHRLIYSNLLAGRLNPLGAVDRFHLGYRLRLWDRPGVLFQDTYVSAQAAITLTPAFGMFGGRLEIKPLAVLRLWAEYQYFHTFGAFGILQSFPSPGVNFSDSRLADNQDFEQDYMTGGQELNLGAQVQAKVWKIAVRDSINFFYTDLDLRDGDTVYYHQTLDTLVPNGGWSLQNEADLLLVLDMGLVIGARWTMVHALYTDDHYPAATRQANLNTHHRVGPLVAYTFFKEPGAMWDAPSLILMIQWYAKHRYRTGADSHAAYPLMLLAFHFKGDLLPW